jgi:hypothetical protein
MPPATEVRHGVIAGRRTLRQQQPRIDPHRLASRSRQSGIALMAMLTLLTLFGLYVFVGRLSATQYKLGNVETDAAILAEAAEALIGRAASDGNRPGSLPCPAPSDAGVAPLLVGNECPAYIGRLPWSTLRVGALRDSAGELLWYALSRGLRDDDSAQPINSQTPVELTLDGAPNIAAIIFSPQAPLPNQSGRPGNTVSDYLDASNSDGDSAYVSSSPSAAFNDQVLAVPRRAIFRVVNQRVLVEVGGPGLSPSQWGLRKYYADNGSFPWADSDADGYGDVGATLGYLPYNELLLAAWLSPNGWPPLIRYERLGTDSVRVSVDSSTLDIVP